MYKLTFVVFSSRHWTGQTARVCVICKTPKPVRRVTHVAALECLCAMQADLIARRHQLLQSRNNVYHGLTILNPVLHMDRPTFIREDGSLEWFENGKRHRDGVKPAVIRADGYHAWWWQDGKCSPLVQGNGWWKDKTYVRYRHVTNFTDGSPRYVFLAAIMK